VVLVDEIDDILAREQLLGMTGVIRVRLNPAEKLTISQAAAKLRLSTSALTRLAILEWLESKFPEYNKWYYDNLTRMTNTGE
jgi:hypothetical protein